MKIINLDNWNRKIPYENFIKYTNPIFSLSTRLDVTELCKYCKNTSTSFFSNFMFVAMKCLNEVEEMRIRIFNGQVVMYDIVNASYIVLAENNAITTCFTKMDNNYLVFYNRSREDIEKTRKNGFSNSNFNSHGTNDCVYISSLHWVDMTSMSNPYDIADAASSSIPRLTWSKFVDENGRKKMTFDIAAHHALVDGEPICRVFIKIQKALNDIEKFLKN